MDVRACEYHGVRQSWDADVPLRWASGQMFRRFLKVLMSSRQVRDASAEELRLKQLQVLVNRSSKKCL
jgi:hypothetical protein